MGLIERYAAQKPKNMRHLGILRVGHGVFGNLFPFRRLLKMVKEQGMIPGFDTEDVMHLVLLQIPDVRAVGA